jgi:hypothetical protein
VAAVLISIEATIDAHRSLLHTCIINNNNNNNNSEVADLIVSIHAHNVAPDVASVASTIVVVRSTTVTNNNNNNNINNNININVAETMQVWRC